MVKNQKKKSAFCAHENVYQLIEKNKTKTWNAHIGQPDIEPSYIRFLDDLIDEEIIGNPKRVLELGCGTGQLLRYLCNRLKCAGHGIDISKTAIKLAKSQTRVKRITFSAGDVGKLAQRHVGKYDLVVDGLCLHCLTNMKDRNAFFESMHAALKPNGVGLIYTMAGPIMRKRFVEQIGPIHGKITYHATPDASDYADATVIGRQCCIPIRYFEHYKQIVTHLVDFSLLPLMFRAKLPTKKRPLTHLAVAVKRQR